jgi:hypothetical protein
MNIILDMDGTLINERMEPRPYLKTFFEFVFQRFNHVSIWTMANLEWFNRVYNEVFIKLMPPGKYFHFVWCRVHFKVIWWGQIVKPLTKVYRAYPLIYNPYNTLFMDDTPSTYIENMRNAIKITTYGNNKLDVELLKIIQKLQFVKKM